jgi:hypothetical protein
MEDKLFIPFRCECQQTEPAAGLRGPPATHGLARLGEKNL